MRIGFDLDDVLVEFLEGFLIYYNEKYGTNFSKEQFLTYDWEETITDKTRPELFKDCMIFHKLPAALEVHDIEGGREVLQALKKDHELVLITSRPPEVKDLTIKLLNKKFGEDIFSDYIFTNGGKGAHVGLSKGEHCLRLKLDLFIEDSEKYAEECRGVCKLLLLDRPWNQKVKDDKSVKRIYSLREVLDEVKELSSNKP